MRVKRVRSLIFYPRIQNQRPEPCNLSVDASLRPLVIPAPEPESIRNQPSLVPRISHGPALTLAQNDLTATNNNNRAANHRARAGHIRKDQVTDQAGPENINILKRRHRADDGDAVSLGDAHSATVKIAPASNSSHQSVTCRIPSPGTRPAASLCRWQARAARESQACGIAVAVHLIRR